MIKSLVCLRNCPSPSVYVSYSESQKTWDIPDFSAVYKRDYEYYTVEKDFFQNNDNCFHTYK